MDGVEAIQILETRLRDVAFRVEDEIELQVVHLYEDTQGRSMLRQIVDGITRKLKTCSPSLTLHYTLQQAIQDIDAIKEGLVKVKEEYQLFKHNLQETKADEVITMGDSSQHASHSTEIMVGRQDEFEIIKHMLIGHTSKQLEIVSIKGMGGIGKTTLAMRVYDDPSIVSHFDKQVWVVASQHHNRLEMLKGLLKSMGCKHDDTEEGLAERLYRNLIRQRYLVVMDDVWSNEAWDDVKACFPDNGNSSRVLLTTRVAEVATCIGSSHEFSHQMHLLNQSESWNLFRKKACNCHGIQFETIGRPIVEKCKGLPLTIIVVAGLFSKLKTLDEWKNTAIALSSSTSTLENEECLRLLSLSYNHLPHNLKACFLYVGVFPEDEEINANNLARLWAAEGLVKVFKNESFKAVARRYIKELMDRNLIMVNKRSSCGRKIKAFRVHDLLHAFCVREAQNQSLLHIVHKNSSNFLQKGVRWVRIQSNGFDISALHSYSKNCRSIFYFGSGSTFLNLKIFNLWRVLYSTDCLRWKTQDFVHLRYLRASSAPNCCDFLFKGIKAWNLHTYDVYEDTRMNILEFPQLQYIRCRRFNGDSPKYVHQNLQKIFALAPSHCTQEYLTKIPYLKKLSIRDVSNDCNECTKNIVCLQQLESLCIYVHGLGCALSDIFLLENLRNVALYHMNSKWKEIDVLSKLPRLEVLKLTFSVLGKKWELPEDEKFCELICLDIWNVNLKHWNASANQFPKLERLLLRDCQQLKEIPNSFAEISTLNLIKLRSCLLSTVLSAKQIQVEQHDYGNDDMVVIVKDTKMHLFDEDDSNEDEFDED